MRLLRFGFTGVLASAVSIAQPHAGAQVAGTPYEANRVVCADEGAVLLRDLRREIKASGQPTWTAAQERERLESDLKQALADPALSGEFTARFAELWEDAGNNGGDPDFLGRPMLVVAACAITVADGWNAGVRDVAQLKRRWDEAKHATYRLPGASTRGSAFAGSGGSSGSGAASDRRESSAPSGDEDPSSSDPVDCVRVNDTPGSFRNDCDIPVYFTYCGVNPEEGSMTPDCAKQKTVGLDGIKAGGVQGGFTRAETIYIFACRQPKTPKDVEFVPGKGLRGYCR